MSAAPNGRHLRRFSVHTGQWHEGGSAVSQQDVPDILLQLEEEGRNLPNRCRDLSEWRAAGMRGFVLDVGCGTGWKVHCMNQWPETRAVGCDMEERVLSYGRNTLAVSQLVLAVGDRLPFPDATFDWVTASEVIEHMQDPRGFLEEAWRVLKPQGRLFLTTPNRLQYLRPWRPRLFWLGLRGQVVLDASHVREFSDAELAELLLPGFTVARTRYVGTLCGWPTTVPIERLPVSLRRVWSQGIQVTAQKMMGVDHPQVAGNAAS